MGWKDMPWPKIGHQFIRQFYIGDIQKNANGCILDKNRIGVEKKAFTSFSFCFVQILHLFLESTETISEETTFESQFDTSLFHRKLEGIAHCIPWKQLLADYSISPPFTSDLSRYKRSRNTFLTLLGFLCILLRTQLVQHFLLPSYGVPINFESWVYTLAHIQIVPYSFICYPWSKSMQTSPVFVKIRKISPVATDNRLFQFIEVVLGLKTDYFSVLWT